MMPRCCLRSSTLPRYVWGLVAVYFLASLAHFAHNAEYISFYPGMPVWLTREQVYLVWFGITGIGGAAFVSSRFGAPRWALGLLGAYGAFGLDGLAHYTLALCSEHSLLANLTIWAEAVTGLLLLLAASLLLFRRQHLSRRHP